MGCTYIDVEGKTVTLGEFDHPNTTTYGPCLRNWNPSGPQDKHSDPNLRGWGGLTIDPRFLDAFDKLDEMYGKE